MSAVLACPTTILTPRDHGWDDDTPLLLQELTGALSDRYPPAHARKEAIPCPPQ